MVMIVKVPGLNAFGKTNGCRDAGNAILEKLKEIHSSEKGKIIDSQLLNLEESHVNNENLEEQNQLIYKNSNDIFQNQDKVVFLGGDHSISYSTVRAFVHNVKMAEKEPCLIVFDAHADCDNPMKEPSHEEWLRGLIDGGEIKPESVLLVGIRNMSREEIKYVSEKKIRIISINQIEENIQEMADVITEFAHGKELYVSLDIDVVDPAFAPSTHYQVAGGLTSRQMIYLIQRIALMKNLRAVDIVEIDSVKDTDTPSGSSPGQESDNIMELPKFGGTVGVGAKILAELI
ncbi:MAG: arginase family protein [Nanoarchaeota archaeon]|nr:arginase family protein [Nanoarchaeota archaeon]